MKKQKPPQSPYVQGALSMCWKCGVGKERCKCLNQIVDKVLAYRPKPKSKAAKKRKRRAAKHA